MPPLLITCALLIVVWIMSLQTIKGAFIHPPVAMGQVAQCHPLRAPWGGTRTDHGDNKYLKVQWKICRAIGLVRQWHYNRGGGRGGEVEGLILTGHLTGSNSPWNSVTVSFRCQRWFHKLGWLLERSRLSDVKADVNCWLFGLVLRICSVCCRFSWKGQMGPPRSSKQALNLGDKMPCCISGRDKPCTMKACSYTPNSSY